ncbi:FAD dependent oxidoreductase [Cantharellus anzutake]|uniref:FAD dependent oxidoreductase n=1 Tax=Cantharellus anzutake TaxID=1750568 RepID=UPI0019050DD9|nr:FAD dependent oxidoreductase [Cantharellus anzutake]KAF8317509.1 FAD dependent oxidoreductase [Cantharellus anzutake]
MHHSGGIIGTSIAYYLSRHPNVRASIGNTAIHLIEASSIAAGASGKGGGFIAKDWHAEPTASLGELSFRLHEELADEHNGQEKWGYRKLTTLGIDRIIGKEQEDGGSRRVAVNGLEVEWLKDADSLVLGGEHSTAQVHPLLMSESLIELAMETGRVKVTMGEVNGIESISLGSNIVNVRLQSGEVTELGATDVVFAAGPWTGKLAKKLLGRKADAAGDIVSSNLSTSIVLSPPSSHRFSPHALFCTLVLPNGQIAQPEFYPRPDNTLYVCGAGLTDKTPLPLSCADVKYNSEGEERLKERVRQVVKDEWIEGAFDRSDFIVQACYRPDSSKTGAPIIGKVSEGRVHVCNLFSWPALIWVGRIWIASGHQVWGICLAPGTGKVMVRFQLQFIRPTANINQRQS